MRDKTRFILFCSVWTVLGAFIYMVLFLMSGGTSVLTSAGSHGILYVGRTIFAQPQLTKDVIGACPVQLVHDLGVLAVSSSINHSCVQRWAQLLVRSRIYSCASHATEH